MFALIGYGGTTPGKRPATRLAFIEGKKVQTWTGHRWITYHKRADEVIIYQTWTRQPADTQVRRAKKRLTAAP